MLEDRALPSTISYLIIGASQNHLPAHFEQRIHDAGGEVRFTVPQIGIAVVKSDDPAFAARADRIPGIRSVVDAGAVPTDRPAVPPPVLPPLPPLGSDAQVTTDAFSALQWTLDAINASGAWAQGASGEGVRVALVDYGFRGDHPDLRFNRQLSRSVLDGPPGESWVSTDPDLGWHGTAVAGVIGALDNGEGTVGISPRVDLVAVRALADEGRYRDPVVSLATMMRGVVYAADIHSDVINVSIPISMNETGFTYDVAGTPGDETDDEVMTPREVSDLTLAFRRATDYAHHKGATIVASAGNDAINFEQHPELTVLPAILPHVVTVSATAPRRLAIDPNTSLDWPASYTNHGNPIDLAAPGGDIDFDLLASGQLVTAFGIPLPAAALDLVFTTSDDPFPGVYPDIHITPWSGTSLAAPHVSAVAALIIEAAGGRMDPDDVFRILKRTADDLGEPGRDAFYGHGRVNAAAAVARAAEEGRGGHGWGHRASVVALSGGPLGTSPGDRAVVVSGTEDSEFSPPQLRPVLATWNPDDPTTHAVVRRRLTAAPDTAPGDERRGGGGTDWFWSDDPLNLVDFTPTEIGN
jgi:subtilisin family serine protease